MEEHDVVLQALGVFLVLYIAELIDSFDRIRIHSYTTNFLKHHYIY